MEIKEIHEEVIQAIREDGAGVGIVYYNRNKEQYNLLPHDEAVILWRQIFNEIETKENLVRLSILSIDDRFLGKEELVPSDITEMRKYRQTFYRRKDRLNSEMVDYVLGCYENVLNVRHKFKMGELTCLR